MHACVVGPYVVHRPFVHGLRALTFPPREGRRPTDRRREGAGARVASIVGLATAQAAANREVGVLQTKRKG